MTIECTFEEFKQYAKTFNDNVDSMNLEELDNSWKCLGLAYIGMYETMWINSAAIVMRMASTEFMKRKEELLQGQ